MKIFRDYRIPDLLKPLKSPRAHLHLHEGPQNFVKPKNLLAEPNNLLYKTTLKTFENI